METLYIYLIKSSGLVALFFLAYYFMLRKETFFTSNRWFLLVGLLTAVLLPLLVFTQTIMVETTPSTIDWSNIPISTTVEEDHTEEYLALTLMGIYCAAVIGLLAKFGFDFYSLRIVLKGKVVHKQGDFKFIDVKENMAPFSFFSTIVYNSALYSPTELESIIEHEKVHSEQHHTIDVLISRVFCIVFWFNPIVWLYKKAILQNLEFIADSAASKKIVDKKAYQITLLKITTQENCLAITNHFYQSLIKKRIVMLNKIQSNKRNSWKYAIVVPALIAFVMLFQIKVIAQEKESEFTIKSGITKLALNVTSTSSEKELNAEKDFFKKTFDLDLKFSNIKLDKNNEIIAIKVVLENNDGIKKVHSVKGNTPIKPFAIFVEKDAENKLSFGFRANVKDNAHLKNHFDLLQAKEGKLAVEKDTDFWSINNFNKDGSNYLIIINGTKQTDSEIIKIPIKEDILSQVILESKEAIEKYGSEGKNGAIEITTGQKKETTTKKSKGIPDETKVYIDGKKRSKKELDELDPNLNESMDVSKNGTEQKIKIITKNYNNISDSSQLMIGGVNMTELNLEKIDPKNINNLQTNKTTRTIKIIAKQKNGIPYETEIYIDGIKSDKAELDKIDPGIIERMDVDKTSTGEKIIKVTTKKEK
ncbi:M56 family metallopeptidase [Flavobacterium sp. Arc2]|uniref:M56 family metallopeptidase n=1 Tax=Flavobacterium sp. Arc2 TaxID=3046685 RepID=UPI00352F48A5